MREVHNFVNAMLPTLMRRKLRRTSAWPLMFTSIMLITPLVANHPSICTKEHHMMPTNWSCQHSCAFCRSAIPTSFYIFIVVYIGE